MLLIRQGLRLGRPMKIVLFVVACGILLLMLSTTGNVSCGLFNRINGTHVNVDGQSFVLESSVDLLRVKKVVVRNVPIQTEEAQYLDGEVGGAEIVLEKTGPTTFSHLHRVQNPHTSQRSLTTPPVITKTLISQRNTTEHKYPWGSIDRECVDIRYDRESLPKVSVIITFHDSEILSNIIETIHCILQRTPPQLLQEIILISDNVKKEDLKGVLDQYVSGLKTDIIRMIRSHVQLGLIKGRLTGIRAAKAPVVVCMDSHMELQERWLEPLLYEISQNKKTLAAPYLDWMEFDADLKKWKITHGASSWKTYFDWNFVFGFQEISFSDKLKQSKHVSRPINCPVTIGTVFAIDKQWFTEIGEFDDQMEAWGGENLDLPIRVWLNGGRVINVPCSHAAHYEAPNSRSYRHGWDPMINRNYKRVAEVWLDEYKNYLYYYRPELLTMDAGNLTSRFALKKRAKYKFKWILDNVFPELGIHDRDSFAHTGARNVKTEKCLMVIGLYNPNAAQCEYDHPAKQGFFWNMMGELRFPIHIFNTQYDGRLRQYVLKTDEFISRYKSPQNAVWFHWKGGPLIDARNNLCLEGNGFQLSMQSCDFELPAQQWYFKTYTPEYEEFVKSPTPTRDTHYLKQLHAVIKTAFRKDWVKVNSLIASYTDVPRNKINP